MFEQFQWIDSIKIVKWKEKNKRWELIVTMIFLKKREIINIRELVHNRTDAQ